MRAQCFRLSLALAVFGLAACGAPSASNKDATFVLYNDHDAGTGTASSADVPASVAPPDTAVIGEAGAIDSTASNTTYDSRQAPDARPDSAVKSEAGLDSGSVGAGLVVDSAPETRATVDAAEETRAATDTPRTRTCAMGQYRSGDVCADCMAGTYSETTTATDCTPCPSGSYSDDGAASCTTCPAGTTSIAGSGSCTPWDSGMGWDADSAADASVEAPPAVVVCLAGEYLSHGVCLDCPAGTTSAAGAISCTTCPAGTYAGAGSSHCTPCPAGWYSAAGAAACATPPVGPLSDDAGTTDAATSGMDSDSSPGTDVSSTPVTNADAGAEADTADSGTDAGSDTSISSGSGTSTDADALVDLADASAHWDSIHVVDADEDLVMSVDVVDLTMDTALDVGGGSMDGGSI